VKNRVAGRRSAVVCALVDPTLKEDAQDKALREGVSFSLAVERLLRQWLDEKGATAVPQ